MTAVLEQQIGKAHVRLFLRTFANMLVWCVSAGLIVSCAWFLVEPFVVPEAAVWLRWTVGGALVSCSMLAAFLLSWRFCPSRLDAALLLDRRFGLKERATTSFMLPGNLRATPAGQALLEDAGRCIGGLHVGTRFPVSVGWSAAAVPLCAALLAVIVLFYNPTRSNAGGDKKGSSDPVATIEEEKQKEDLDAAMKKLDPPTKNPDDPQAGDEKADDFDKQMGAIAHRPRETKEERERRWAEMAKLEADMKKKKAAEKDKEDKIKDALKKDETERLKKKPKEGPAKDLQDALDKGDTKKAQEEIDKLTKKMKDDQLTKEEQQQLQQQLEDMEKELQRLSREKDEEKLLKELDREQKIDREALDRELDELKKKGDAKQDIDDIKKKLEELEKDGKIDKEAAEEAIKQLEQDKQDLKDLEDAAKDLKDAQDSMKDGNKEEAAKKLEQPGQKMTCKQCKGNQDKLTQQLSRVQQAKQQMAKAAAQAGNKGSGSGPNKGGVGSGKRPEEKDDGIGFDRTKIDGDPDATGASEFTGYGPKPNKPNPKDPKEIAEQIQPRSQDAARAVGQQKKILKDATEMTKGFFENLGDQKPDKK